MIEADQHKYIAIGGWHEELSQSIVSENWMYRQRKREIIHRLRIRWIRQKVSKLFRL